jgi:23S rRNA (pseudouridine1915-N3)-methyltransferase
VVQLRILSIGSKSPGWVQAGYEDYSRRLKSSLKVSLEEIPAPKHHADHNKIKAQEAEKLLSRIGDNDWVVALDEHGRQTSSLELAACLQGWKMRRTGVALLIGGADGFDSTVLARANESISLSKLTLPHYLVRVVLAEALYRAESINEGHPYHRV